MARIPKTPAEIALMIIALEKQKEALPRYTMFNDDNHLLYDTQISILKGEITDENEIYDNEEEYGSQASDIAYIFEWMLGGVDDTDIVDEEHLVAAKVEVVTAPKLNVCTKQCGECPFSKTSMKGWLANYTIENIEEYMRHEALFPCHMMMKDGDMNQAAVQTAIEEGKLKLCRGYVESIIKSAKSPFRNKFLVQAVKDVKAQGLGENSMDIMEFRTHHTLSKK